MYSHLMGVIIAQLLIRSAITVQFEPKILRSIPLVKEERELYNSGYKIDAKEMPYIVGLRITGKHSNWFCAGSIIDNRWIVTVASCILNAVQVKIGFGASNLKKPMHEVRVSARCLFVHPDFSKLYENDIALIHMPFVAISPQVKPVVLPKRESSFTNTWGNSAGWGVHEGAQGNRTELYMMQVKMVNDDTCNTGGYGGRFRPGMLCGMLPNMETGCHLDSGSPLVPKSTDALIGMASLGDSIGCNSKKPLIYTNIVYYLDWINQVITRASE